MSYKRVYDTKVKKFLIASGVSIPLIFGIFFYLQAAEAIAITGFSGNVTCSGTIEDPCYAYINFTALKDIYIYPTTETTWQISTNKPMKEIIMQRSWGAGWRTIDLSKTWNKDVKYAIKFSAGQDYQLRFIGYKEDAFEDVKWSFGEIDPVWGGVGKYKLMREEIAGRSYTPNCLTECHLVVNFSLYNNFNLKKSDFTKKIKNQVGNFEILDWGFDYLRNVTYIDTIENGTDVCDPYDLWNSTSNSMQHYPNCTWTTNPYQIEKWRWEWKPVPNNINVKAGKSYVIDLWIKKSPTLGESMIDIVPKIKNYAMGNLAWWNSSWGYQRNITFTERSIQSQALSNYPIAYYVPVGNGCAHSNCSDFRVVNSSHDEINFNVTVYNATHNYIIHNITVGAAGTVDYEVYYDNSGASETSYFKTWTFMSERQDSFEDADYTSNPTWSVGQSGGGTWTFNYGTGKELDYAVNGTTDGANDNARFQLNTPAPITDGSAYGMWLKWSHPEAAHNYNGRISFSGVATEHRCQIHHTNGTYLACEITGTWDLVYTPIRADIWYRLVYDFNYTANTINITIYDGNMTHLNSTVFANTAEQENILYIDLADSSTTKESFFVDVVSVREGIVEPEPSVGIGSETTAADTTKPWFSGNSTNTTIFTPASALNFTINVTDDNTLDNTAIYIFSSNNSGTWLNSSNVSFVGSATKLTAWNVTVLNSSVNSFIEFKWYANDTSNNWNVSDTYSITTTENPIKIFQWVQTNFTNNTHIRYNLTIWVYNNLSTTLTNLQITPDSMFSSAYTISSLAADAENQTVFTNITARQSVDEVINISAATASDTASGTSNALSIVNPVDPPTKAAVDTCTYVSGAWAVDCSENCVIDTDTDIGANDITFSGAGTIYLNAIITVRHRYWGTGCRIVYASGAEIIETG